MAKLRCRNKECGGTYFSKLSINEFHDYGGNLYGTLPEVDVDNDIKAYKCVACGTINLPTLDYVNTEADRKLAANILMIADGKAAEIKQELPKSRRVAPGTMQRREQEKSDPSQHGKFVRS